MKYFAETRQGIYKQFDSYKNLQNDLTQGQIKGMISKRAYLVRIKAINEKLYKKN